MDMFFDEQLDRELVAQCKDDGIEKMAVGAIVFNASGDLFLMQRAMDEFMGGCWEFPGGGVDPGETLVQALSREVSEEAGLSIFGFVEYINSFDYADEEKKFTRQFNFAVSASGDYSLSDEHQDAKWFTAEEIRDMDELDPVFRHALDCLGVKSASPT